MLIAHPPGRRAIPYKDPEKRKAYHKKYNKKNYAKNRQAFLDKSADHKRRIRAWLKQYKDGMSCEICREEANECLEFHHRNPKDKRFSIAHAGSKGLSIPNIKREIKKCSCICANCHRKIHSGRLANIIGESCD